MAIGKKIKEATDEILKYVGGESNIISFDSCMTRVRFILKDNSKVNKTKLEKLKGVMGVVQSDKQAQVIVGPGIAAKIAERMKQDTKIYKRDMPEFKGKDKVKAKVKKKYNEPITHVFKRIAGKFKPHKKK